METDYVLGDYLPSLTDSKARRKIDGMKAKIRAKKFPPDTLKAYRKHAADFVNENSKDGQAYLMINANLVWGYACQVIAFDEIAKESKP